MLDQEKTATEGGGERPEFVPIRSKYEFVMASAKEAERLNDHYRKTQIPPEGKVTVEACRRIRKGMSRILYEENAEGSEDAPKESTYFFGA